MRILLFTTEYPPYSGGVATFCQAAAAGLHACGAHVAVVAPAYGNGDRAQDQPAAWDVCRVRGGMRDTALAQRALLRAIRRQQPDVVLLANGKATLYASTLAPLPVPTAVYLHGSEVLDCRAVEPGGASRAQRDLVAGAYRDARWILANSHSTAELFSEAFQSSRHTPCAVTDERTGPGATVSSGDAFVGVQALACLTRVLDPLRSLKAVLQPKRTSRRVSLLHCSRPVVVHLGIDPARFADMPSDGALAADRARWNLTGKPMVLCVARLDRDKGQDMLLRAWPEIQRLAPGCVLHLAGSGPCGEDLQSQAAELSLGDQVRFLGDLGPDELRTQYALCDVFTMISRRGPRESFGLVYLEANLFGKPVVAGRTGGVAEAVEDGVTGVMVDPESPDQVAAAVIGLLSDPEQCRAMGAAGRQRVLNGFTHVHMARKMLDLWSADGRRSSRIRTALWAARKLLKLRLRAAWKRTGDSGQGTADRGQGAGDRGQGTGELTVDYVPDS